MKAKREEDWLIKCTKYLFLWLLCISLTFIVVRLTLSNPDVEWLQTVSKYFILLLPFITHFNEFSVAGIFTVKKLN